MIIRKSRWQSIIIVSLFLTLVSACGSRPVQFADYAEESGFGGTGIIAYSVVEDEGKSGFGGTGIVGNISAFGSIWVNGIEIDYPEDVSIESNLQSTQQQLKLGQTVMLETEQGLSPDNLPTTKRIRIHYQFVGPIQRMSEEELWINDQQVTITADTQVDQGLSLVEGEYIAVNAMQAQDGHWQASRLNLNLAKIDALQALPDFTFSSSVTRVIVDERMEYLHEQWHIRDHLKPNLRRELMKQNRRPSGESRRPMENMRQMRRDRMDPNEIRFQLQELHSIHQNIHQFPPPPMEDRQEPVTPPQ
jgi:hypothetical protein